jgi:hypothetical protein
MAKKPTADANPVEQAAADAEKRRTEFLAEQEERERKLDALREEGRLQRERDQEEHDRAVRKEALAAAQAREKAAQDERDEIAHLYDEARRVKAVQDEAFDREFAKLLAARREAELDPEHDPSLGPQVTLDRRGLVAKAARGGITPRSMQGNLDALSIAVAEEAQP